MYMYTKLNGIKFVYICLDYSYGARLQVCSRHIPPKNLLSAGECGKVVHLVSVGLR